MSTLKEKAQSILDEKNSKILPENIKNGIQIFDITGEYEGENIAESRIVHFIKTYSKCTVYIETKADNSTILNSLNSFDTNINIEATIVALNRSDETVNIKINDECYKNFLLMQEDAKKYGYGSYKRYGDDREAYWIERGYKPEYYNFFNDGMRWSTSCEFC